MTVWAGGLPFSQDGALQVISRPPSGVPSSAVRLGGWAVDPVLECAYVEDAGAAVPATAKFLGGFAMTEDGALYITSDAVTGPFSYLGGRKVRQDGALVVLARAGVPGTDPYPQGWAADGSTGASLVGGAGMFFWAPFDDAGSGAVDTTLVIGTGSATFTRAGATATTILSNGLVSPVISANVARSYYDPTTLEYMGYLAEGARTNLCLQSEAFDAAAWTKTRATVSGTTTAPDGNNTADKIVEDATAAASHGVGQNLTATADVNYAVSMWVKAAERSWARILISNGANSFGRYFNVGTGALGTATTAGTGANVSAEIKSYPNGWYRCTVVGSVGSGATAITLSLQMANGDNGASYDGDNTSGLYLWGAQFENNVSFASSYIPTAGATVTRNADQLTYTFAGNADATQGACYAELYSQWAAATGTTNTALAPDTGLGLLFVPNNAPTQIRLTDGTAQASKTGLTDMSTASRKRAGSWGSAELSVTGDGATVATAVFDGNIGSTGISVGHSGGAQSWFGTIRNVRIFQQRLSNAQLQSMTS